MSVDKRSIQIKIFSISASLATVVCLMNACADFRSYRSKTVVSSSASSSSSSATTELFDDVQKVLNNNCVSCHRAGGQAPTFQLNSPQDFANAGLIVPGKPRQSKLIMRLKNFDGGSTNKNMPLGGTQLSEANYQTLYGWILDLPSEGSPFQCVNDQVNLANLNPTHAKRLSVRQFRNTLIDLFSLAMDRAVVTTSVDAVLSQYPLPGDTGATFSRDSNAYYDEHATAHFEIANLLATNLAQTQSTTIIQQFIALGPGSCSSVNVSSLSAVCRTQLIRNFVSRAFRRPLREAAHSISNIDNEAIDELAALTSEFNGLTTQQGLSNLIFRTMLSPHFQFQIEDQNLVTPLPSNASVYRLGSFAIASRLSYRFWNTMPDATLWNLAASENLNDDASYLKALNHIISRTDKLDSSLREYYYDWLHLGRTPQFNENPRFDLIAGTAIQFNNSLRSAMIGEVEELGSYVTTSGGGFSDLFTTDVSFARHDHLMALYGGVSRAPTSVTAENAVRFAPGQRAGLLTRAALLVSGSEIASPILRGAHLRKDILCLDLGAPPGNALEVFESIPVPPNSTTRERVHIKTAGPACIGCHGLINPLGFGLSRYNAFGMHINQEPIFNSDGTAVVANVNVDSSVDLSSTFGPGSAAADGIELSRLVARQQSAKVCFAEKFMSYAFSRTTERAKDACRLDKIYTNLESGGRLVDMIRAAALDIEFRLRKLD